MKASQNYLRPSSWINSLSENSGQKKLNIVLNKVRKDVLIERPMCREDEYANPAVQTSM